MRSAALPSSPQKAAGPFPRGMAMAIAAGAVASERVCGKPASAIARNMALIGAMKRHGWLFRADQDHRPASASASRAASSTGSVRELAHLADAEERTHDVSGLAAAASLAVRLMHVNALA